MSDIAIRVENLSKEYRIAHSTGGGRRYRTLRDDVVGFLKNPLRNRAQNETFLALKDVSFEVKHGEVLGIIGRNGAGKSTLLKILSRITRPTSGFADIYGRIGSLLEVGTGFHPELTGRENIYLNGAILGMARSEIARHFDEIVDFAEIEQFLDTPAKRYSSGMYMRLAFAVAAHLNAEILIVDEVLAVGDAEFQKKCLGKMGEVASSGRTVLFVSHNMNAVQELCNSAILLEHGNIAVQSDDVREVTSRYLSSGFNASGVWQNDGNSFDNRFFRPSSMTLSDKSGVPLAMPMSNVEDAYLTIEGMVKQADPALCIGCAVYDETNDLLFWSYFSDVSGLRGPQVKPGAYKLQMSFPKRLLNEGTYRIELIACVHNREWICEPGRYVPTIQISIQGGLSESPYWMVRRPGLLAPVLEWSVTQVDDD